MKIAALILFLCIAIGLKAQVLPIGGSVGWVSISTPAGPDPNAFYTTIPNIQVTLLSDETILTTYAGSTHCVDGNTVGRWKNKTPPPDTAITTDVTDNGYLHHTFHTGGPGGMPFIASTNGQYLYALATITNWAPPLTVFMVYRYFETGETRIFFDSSDNLVNLFFRTDDTLRMSTDGGAELSSGHPLGNGWNLVTGIFREGGNASKLRTNGVEASSGVLTAENLSWGTLAGLSGDSYPGTYDPIIHIAAVIVANTNLSSISGVGDYWLTNTEINLKSKFGL